MLTLSTLPFSLNSYFETKKTINHLPQEQACANLFPFDYFSINIFTKTVTSKVLLLLLNYFFWKRQRINLYEITRLGKFGHQWRNAQAQESGSSENFTLELKSIYNSLTALVAFDRCQGLFSQHHKTAKFFTTI